MLFDTHAHYWDERFIHPEELPDAEALLSKMKENGVYGIVNVATCVESSQIVLEQSRRYDFVYAAVGIHPSDCPKYENVEDALDKIRQIAKMNSDKVVAIGEIGLDYYWPGYDKDMQKRFFAAQLDLAAELDLPALVHDRDAHGDTFEIIKSHPATRGILHSYSGSIEMARDCIDLGWYISFSGSVTFKNAHRLQAVAANLPSDKVLVETDCPYLTPHPHRGKRNDSTYMTYTVECLSDLWGISREEAEDITYNNAMNFFRISELRKDL